jgi:ABC-2 type transport system permease protein
MTTTTTAAGPVRVTARPGGHRPLANVGTMVRFLLRRDRIKLPAWVGGLGLFVVYLTTALPTAYPSEEDLAAATGLFADPVGRMLIGPGYGFDAPTYEVMVANGYGLYLQLLAALMSILLVVRHTRVEEQSGRAELVRANVVGRHTALLATLVVATITNVAAALAIIVVMVGVGGFGVTGSVLLGSSVAAVGLAFAGVATLTAQITEYSRAAAGAAGAVLGTAFVIRAGGDMAREGGSALSWLSPLGWGPQSAPFVLDRWWPLSLPLALGAITAAGGYALSARRDLGASLFAVRPGRPRAHPSLGTGWGLALRLQRAAIIGWAVALSTAGLVFGAYADAMLSATEDMPAVFTDLFGAESIVAGYLGYMAVFLAFLTGVYAILAVQGLRNEETSGRGEPVLATPISRSAWLGTTLAVTVAGVTVISAATGAASGIGAAVVTGDGRYVSELIATQLNLVPAVLVVLGVATLLFGAAPRAIPATWAVVVYAMVVGTFGPMLDLPQLAFDLSPFEHPAGMPLEPFAVAPTVILILVAAATWALGLWAFRRRAVNAS